MENNQEIRSSKIYVQNRALGYVSNHIPCVTRYIERRKENLIVTCTQNVFHTYNSNFSLLTVSPVHPGDISCLAADKYHIYTACKGNVFAWRRGNELKHTYKGGNEEVHSILPFGNHIITVNEASTVRVFNIREETQESEINFNNDVFKITVITHPPTYVNKIVIGSEQGSLELWNLKSCKKIYNYNGWNSSVTALEPAPARDIVAIGLSDGRIMLHNLKCDETVFELVQDYGAVISISFRTDEHTIMATGSMQGHIIFWDLEKRKVDNQLRFAHHAAVAGLQFYFNEPLLVSSSPDNSLKLWIFDFADGAGRLLRVREGHASPPITIRFYGHIGNNIVTAGGDSSLKVFSTVTEKFNRSFGRASYNRKATKRKGKNAEDPLIMPPITHLAMETTREKDWNNIVASHEGLGMITTWSFDRSKMGELKLLPEKFKSNKNIFATSICITKCGNFVVIGYSSGHLERFNLQSGIHRASYGNESGAHHGSISGVMVDSLNQTVISAGRDRFLKFWNFKTHNGPMEPRIKLLLEEPVEWLRYQDDNSDIAVALQDFTILLIDIYTARIVRKFEGHQGRLTDAAFSPNSRWLITASMDCTIRTWDIPSSKLIDIFEIPEACISLDFSPTGEYLASAHVGNFGIYLWSNKTLFSHVSLKSIKENEAIPKLSLPGSTTEEDREINIEEYEEEYVSPEYIDESLITMSSLPDSRWRNLFNLDIIKKRNKPVTKPKVPEQAPFFLPTIPSIDLKFDFSNVVNTETNKKVLNHPDLDSISAFSKLLLDAHNSDDFNNIVDRMKSMGPSMIDFEIQSLSIDLKHSEKLLLQFMNLVLYIMKSKRNIDLSQSYLAVFLKWHDKKLMESKKLLDLLVELDAQIMTMKNLRNEIFYCLSAVQKLKM